MRTYDHGFESSKGKVRRKKKGSNLEKLQRHVASMSKEQISRLIADAGKTYTKGEDATGDMIFENTKRHEREQVQAKLEISQPEDQSEKQADKVAEGVTKGDVGISKMALEQTPSDINAKSDDAGMSTTPGFDQQLQGTKGQGSKLDANVRMEMEGHLGTDLSGVNIHTGGEAQKMSGDINAKAFAHGQDVYFNEGQYNVSSQEGKGLLAHELTHTVQQSDNKVQSKVQRQATEFTKVRDYGERRHAEGAFHGDNTQGGYIITPLVFPITKEYYDVHPDEKKQMLSEHPGTKLLYNTFYSLSERFRIPIDKLIEANPGVAPEKIPAGKKIIIPYVPEEEFVRIEPIQIKSIPVDYKQPELKLPQAERTYQDFKRYETAGKSDDKILADVQKRAWEIVQSDANVSHAFQFLHKMKRGEKQAERDKELARFFEGGDYKPVLIFKAMNTVGATDEQPGDEKNKIIKLNKKDSFTLMVYTYLHEMNHYMDIWYTSEAAKNEHKHKTRKERRGGIRPEKDSDLSKQEQQAAMVEGLNATIEEIIMEMKRPAQPNDHPRVESMKDKAGHSFRDRYNIWKQAPGSKTEADFDEEIRNELKTPAVDAYSDWGLDVNSKNELQGSGLEMGFAFEKMAYGFYVPGQQPGEWAKDVPNKFEKKYWTYLEER